MKKIKILIVGFSFSVHTARWINQILDQGWEVRLFPSNDDGAVSVDLKKVDVYHSFYASKYNTNKSVKLHGKMVNSRVVAYGLRRLLSLLFGDYRSKQLKKIIKGFRPDIIHSMEMQSGAYLVDKVKQKWTGKFPKWIVTNWGSDIFYCRKFEKHARRISEILDRCDFYSCECNRDVTLAKEMGFKKEVLPVFPNSGGYDIKMASLLRKKILPSKRKIILVKGYQHFAGRAFVALEALKLCSLNGYEVWVYSVLPGSGVDKAFMKYSKESGVKVKFIPLGTPHKKMLSIFAKSRVAIGLSISDAISTMVLESMVMGCFPIQSNTSCANEWIKSGYTGLIVPPEEPIVVAEAIKKALAEDDLVDQASRANWDTAKQYLDQKIIKRKTIEFYKTVLKGHDN